MKAFFIMCSLKHVEDILKKNDIYYDEWSSDIGEYEIRIDLSELNSKQKKIIINKFNIKEQIDEYDYLIFWK